MIPPITQRHQRRGWGWLPQGVIESYHESSSILCDTVSVPPGDSLTHMSQFLASEPTFSATFFVSYVIGKCLGGLASPMEDGGSATYCGSTSHAKRNVNLIT